jgi:hypothetical protein
MYNATTVSPGPILLPHMMRAILTKRLTFRGFIVSDFATPWAVTMSGLRCKNSSATKVRRGSDNSPSSIRPCKLDQGGGKRCSGKAQRSFWRLMMLSTSFKCSPMRVPLRRCNSSATRARHSARIEQFVRGGRGSGGLAMHEVMRALIALWLALIAMLGLFALVIATSRIPCVPYGLWPTLQMHCR